MTPSLFIAHGAPLLAIQDNEYTRFLSQLGEQLDVPKAVVLFSAHWTSRVQKVSHVQGTYDTIYDFGGFPEELYQIKYPALGAPDVAGQVTQLLQKQGLEVSSDTDRGLDHGAWVVLRLLFPQANVPVVSMSVSPNLRPEEQYRVGQALSSLRNEDVLVIGSGGTVHNLRAVNMGANGGQADEWASGFDDWLTDALTSWDVDALFDYEKQAPGASLAVPPYGNEHFVPLLYAMGAADDVRQATLLHRSYQYGNLSHSAWQFG